MMRRVLVERVWARKMAKRSGGWERVTLDASVGWLHRRAVDVLDRDRALNELAMLDARKAHIAELRFFSGLSLEEVGHASGLSVATVEREWQDAAGVSLRACRTRRVLDGGEYNRFL